MVLTIRDDQLKVFNELANKKYLSTASMEIEDKMRSRIPDIIQTLDQEQLQVDINEAVTVADQYGISDPEQLYDWCVIRIVCGQKFYQMEEFKDILEHRFLTPFAKARHLITIFFTIHDMQRKGYLCAQQ
ncbi:MAG: hypothetical protein L3J98_10040 [Gammaproteobacteria bacterium]|nr:hypothetical protein [Gammaproteobacteria bacterium]MCF6260475.1 hypothetical protein [Gammaproteobacteria bacterium]